MPGIRRSAGIRTPRTQNRQLAMQRARKATGNVGRAQQTVRAGTPGKLAKVGTAARAFTQRTPAQKTGLTAAQRASLKQTPAQKQARIASAQGRVGTLMKNFAQRQRGGRPAAGRLASAQGRTGTLMKNFAQRQRGGTAAGAISALSRPRKPIRGVTSRGSSRSGGR